MRTLSASPEQANMIGAHSIRSEGEFPKTKYIAVFEYPDCTREYDGREWKMIPKRVATTFNLFLGEIAA